RLNNFLSSRTTRPGTRFSLTVQSPAQYQGAVLEGVVIRADQTSSGRSDLVFDFDTIRFRNGRTSEYSGVLSAIRPPDGTTIYVNSENVVRPSQTDEVIQRGAIGAAVGAIIGALA